LLKQVDYIHAVTRQWKRGVAYYFIIHLLQEWVISISLLGAVPSPG